jgi:rhamnulokinase
MRRARNYVAVDLGASSGRVLLGRWNGERFELAEMHRFANGPVTTMGELHWDVLSIWSEIKTGLARCAAAAASGRSAELAGIGVDTWGVDYALLDRDGRLLGNPYHYRDARTDGILERAFQLAPRSALYEETGIVPMQINTLFQLLDMVRNRHPQLEAAATLLTMPNLFSYWLTGRRAAEYTHATTTQCLSIRDGAWAAPLLARFGIPAAIFPPIVAPGTVLGPLLGEVASEIGLLDGEGAAVIAVGSHDTASAVAAIPGLDRGSAYISSGTWSLMGVETGTPIVTERSLAGGFTNEGGVGGTIRLLRNIPGLWLLQQCRRQWQREGRDYDWDELTQEAEKAEPLLALVDPDAPDFQNPPDMPAAVRAYCLKTGQPAPETVGAVVRCCLESLAVRYRTTFADLQEVLGHPLDTVRIVGGGSRNRLLCQLAADSCGVPVVAGPTEATALGNVMLQAIATGDLDDIGAGRAAVAASVTLQTYEPHPRAGWAEAISRLQDRAAGTAE